MANTKKGPNPVAAGVVGAVVGAAVGAGAVALSDEKNRKALGKTVKNLTEQGAKAIDSLKERSEELQNSAQKKLAQTQDKMSKSKK